MGEYWGIAFGAFIVLVGVGIGIIIADYNSMAGSVFMVSLSVIGGIITLYFGAKAIYYLDYNILP